MRSERLSGALRERVSIERSEPLTPGARPQHSGQGAGIAQRCPEPLPTPSAASNQGEVSDFSAALRLPLGMTGTDNFPGHSLCSGVISPLRLLIFQYLLKYLLIILDKYLLFTIVITVLHLSVFTIINTIINI